MKASRRMFGFLGLMLGGTAGAMTGVAIKGLIGDPLVSGSGALAFYAAFGLSSLMTMYVMLNYLTMNLRVSSDGVDIRLGMKSSVVNGVDIKDVRIAEPKSRMIRVAAQARPDMRSIAKLWSVLGVKTGIEIDIRQTNSGGDDRIETWFIASNDPETLNGKINLLILTPARDDSGEADLKTEGTSEVT